MTSIYVRTRLKTFVARKCCDNRTLCYFYLINIFTLAKTHVYTCSFFNSALMLNLIVLDGCYDLLWPFYLLFLWVCCAWFKQYRQKCIFVRFLKKSHESLDFDLDSQEKWNIRDFSLFAQDTLSVSWERLRGTQLKTP